MSDYDVTLVESRLMTPGKGFFKTYFFHNDGRKTFWRVGDIDEVYGRLERSPFTQQHMGVVTSFATKENGITKIFYFHPEMGFLNMGPLSFRNTDFSEPDTEYPIKDGIVIPGTRVVVPEMTCWGEMEAVSFEQRLLSENGDATYKLKMKDKFFDPATPWNRLTHRD